MAKCKKNFVDSKDTALLLAGSIADIQEEKTSAKKKLNRERHDDHARTKTPHSISDNDRLKKAKEVVLAQKARAKKRRSEARKKAYKSKMVVESLTQEPQTKKKGVSFA